MVSANDIGIAIPTVMAFCIFVGIGKRALKRYLARRNASDRLPIVDFTDAEEFSPWTLNSQLPPKSKSKRTGGQGVRCAGDVEMARLHGEAARMPPLHELEDTEPRESTNAPSAERL